MLLILILLPLLGYLRAMDENPPLMVLSERADDLQPSQSRETPAHLKPPVAHLHRNDQHHYRYHRLIF